jgi:hypothetical protein
MPSRRTRARAAYLIVGHQKNCSILVPICGNPDQLTRRLDAIEDPWHGRCDRVVVEGPYVSRHPDHRIVFLNREVKYVQLKN